MEEDFSRFKKALELDGENLTGLARIPLGNRIKTPFYKARKFRCKSLNAGSMSGFRLIFRWQCHGNVAEVTFIEIYHKNQQANHDVSRIETFCKDGELL